ETEYSLIKQYQAMLEAEEVTLHFEPEALVKIAEICERVNSETEDIGARRLHTILEYVLEDISFDASNRKGTQVLITAEFVESRISEIAEKRDLSQYVL
ncbi:MAG TPA: HslU--HslV peptidase ATPase subunit, partial [Candidatus Hydrogenedentes bacterium]|nr:HslU--HslV peptidase ATPase subunit [Candidatus Hydrogenedentota bacterium]